MNFKYRQPDCFLAGIRMSGLLLEDSSLAGNEDYDVDLVDPEFDF